MVRVLMLSFLIGLLLLVMVGSCESNTIKVRSQQEFDALQENLMQMIKAGEKNIKLVIYSGTYVAKEQQLTLKDIKAPNTKIRITGKNATIIPDGTTYQDGDTYQGTFSPDHSWMNSDQDVNIWSDVRYADGLIEMLNAEKKTCRLKSKEPLPADIDIKNVYILIPHWFKSSVYKVDRITNGYIYFTATDLTAGYKKNYNVNDDNNYGKQDIRYKLCNVDANRLRIANDKVQLPLGMTAVRDGHSQCFFQMQGCRLRSLEITGLKFYGNSSEESKAALHFHKNNCEGITISNCEFRGIRSIAISASSTDNLTVENCHFADCYLNALISDNNSGHTIVKNCTFNDMGKRMLNTPCVRCNGSDYLISGNRFNDFGYCGIAVGVWYKHKKEHPCNGTVENNSLVYTDAYINNIANSALMDGGAIYLWTKNDGAIIKNNYIHNYTGLKFNNGIYCDDGAYNFRIIGNVITGISKGNCIDSRRVARVEASSTPDSDIERANVNIVIKDNVVNGTIRFVGNEVVNNGCVKGENYIIITDPNSLPKMTYSNVLRVAEDVWMDDNRKAKDKIKKSRKR